jgi:hypothetical protein
MHNQPDEFDQIINRNGYGMNPHSEYIDPHPYGSPAQPVKPGLTSRGKAAIGIGGAVIACGSLLGWQHYSAQQAANQAQAQAFELQRQQIELEKLKEINKANAAAQKSEAAENSERNKLVEACVDSNKKMVGRMLGVTYQSVRSDCEAQYPISTSSGDMQAAATSQDVTTSDSGGVSTGLLIGAGALGLGLVVFAKKGTKSHPA